MRPEEKIKSEIFVELLKEDIQEQKLSVVTELSNNQKVKIVESLVKGDVQLTQYPKNQTVEEYSLMRKFTGILLRDIMQSNKSLVWKEFSHLLNKEIEEDIRNVFNKRENRPDDDINVSVDQSSNLTTAIMKGLKYPTINENNNVVYGELLDFLEELCKKVNCPNPEYQIDLSKESWYVFNDNYGTSEEKLFIKFFKTDIEPKLKAKGLEYYVVRNERIPELAIYSFEHGERFEPDYLLFVAKKNSDNISNYQTYIEPKGNHLLKEDKWKEEFLNEIGEKHYISKTLISGNEYKIMGLPFYNDQYRREDFLEKVSAWIDTI